MSCCKSPALTTRTTPVSTTHPSPRPLFLYGTLLSPPLLAWLITGNALNTPLVQSLTTPAHIYGYTRCAVLHADYPALVASTSKADVVHGLLLKPQSRSQRLKADNFEGETYAITPVEVHVEAGEMGATSSGGECEVVNADAYVWTGDAALVSEELWDLFYRNVVRSPTNPLIPNF